jgi:hypothetical protein
VTALNPERVLTEIADMIYVDVGHIMPQAEIKG